MEGTTKLKLRAEDAAKAGNHVAVLRIAGEVLRGAPEDHPSRMAIATALYELDRPEESVAVFRAAAELLVRRGFLLPAIAALSDAQRRFPDDLDLMAALGALHEKIVGLPPSRRAHALPPSPPAKIPGGSGSLLRFTDDEALIARALELATARDVELGVTVSPQAVPLFSDLSREAFVGLVGEVDHRRVPPDQTIVEQGSAGASLFVLISGEVRVVRSSDEETVELARLPAGSVFGEMALITQQPRIASVVTAGDVELFEVGVEHIESVAKHHPSITNELVQFARQRMMMNVLATSPVFQPLDDEQRRTVLAQFASRVVAADEIVIAEGHKPAGLYLVASGQMRITKQDDDSDRMIATLGPGDVFGEIASLQDGLTTATATASTKTVLLHLDRDKLAAVVEANPAIRIYLEGLSETRSAETDALMRLEDAVLSADDLVLL